MKNSKFLLLILVLLAANGMAQVSPQWARYAAISPDGSTVVFTYKGDLYRVPSSGGMHNAEDRHPVFTEDQQSIYYLSERSGVFNVHKKGLTVGGQSTQLTDFKTHPVRSLSMGAGTLCFT